MDNKAVQLGYPGGTQELGSLCNGFTQADSKGVTPSLGFNVVPCLPCPPEAVRASAAMQASVRGVQESVQVVAVNVDVQSQIPRLELGSSAVACL